MHIKIILDFYHKSFFLISYNKVVMYMKRININKYHKSMGLLIDIQHPLDYAEYHHPDSVNIPYDKLMLNYKTLLDKSKPYFITCKLGTKSRKAVSILEYYGYDVTQTSYK